MQAMPRGTARLRRWRSTPSRAGETPPIARALKGLAAAGRARTGRATTKAAPTAAVHAVRFATAIYVLHVSQKQIEAQAEATLQRDVDLIKERLKRAAELHRDQRRKRAGNEGQTPFTRRAARNVFAHLGFRDSSQESAEGEVTVEIYRLLTRSAASRERRAPSCSCTTQAQVIRLDAPASPSRCRSDG